MTGKSHFDWLHRHHEDYRRVRRGQRLVMLTAAAMLAGASLDFTTSGATEAEAGVSDAADALKHTANLVAQH